MALLWFDGFETYENHSEDWFSAMAGFWAGMYFFGGGMGTTCRTGIRAFNLGNGHNCTLTMREDYTTLIVGMAVYDLGTNLRTGTTRNVSFRDLGTEQVGLALNGGEWELWAAGSLVATSSGANWKYNVWNYLEVKFTIDNSSGVVVVKVNGVEVINETSIDTQASANAYVNQLVLFNFAASSTTTWFDDMYICDNTGSKNNDFLGDCRVDCIRPSGAGSHTDFTPSAGSNYENVDDSPYPDMDSTYNQGDGTDQDSYAMSDLPDPPSGTTIHGVKSQVVVKKTDGGVRGYKILTRSGGSDYLSDEILLSDKYVWDVKIYEDNPDDAAAWEDADVNGLEIGVEVTS